MQRLAGSGSVKCPILVFPGPRRPRRPANTGRACAVAVWGPAAETQRRCRGLTTLRNPSAAPASSASSPTTPRSLAWWGRCCWSSTRTGSWRAAACSPPKAWRPSRNWATPLPCKPSAPERGRTQAPGDQGCSAPTGRSGLDRRPGAGAPPSGDIDHSSQQHIRDRRKDLTSHSSRFILAAGGASAPPD